MNFSTSTLQQETEVQKQYRMDWFGWFSQHPQDWVSAWPTITNLRSNSQWLLSLSWTRTVLAGHGSRFSAVSVWSDLPASTTISSFEPQDSFIRRSLCQLAQSTRAYE